MSVFFASVATGVGNQDMSLKQGIAWITNHIITELYIILDAICFHFIVNFHLHRNLMIVITK